MHEPPAAPSFRHLSAPVDGTTDGERAIPLALALAARLDARVTLVHVATPPPLPVDDVGTAMAIAAAVTPEAAGRYLDTLAGRVAPPGAVAVDTALLAGEPAEAIAAHARRAGVDLVVMPTHAHGAVARALLGSVALHAARASGVPSLLLPPHAGVLPPRHLLLPSDGSPLAARLVDVVAPLAAALGARCTVLGVAGDDAPEEELAGAVERAVARLRATGVAAAGASLAHGRPATAVAAHAEELGADLIALATHEQRGIGRLLGGSVADAVVHGAHCPVLLWHPRDEAGEAPVDVRVRSA